MSMLCPFQWPFITVKRLTGCLSRDVTPIILYFIPGVMFPWATDDVLTFIFYRYLCYVANAIDLFSVKTIDRSRFVCR